MTSRNSIEEQFGTGWETDEIDFWAQQQNEKEAQKEALKGISPEQTQEIAKELQETNEKLQEVIKQKEISDKELDNLLEQANPNNNQIKNALNILNELEETRNAMKELGKEQKTNQKDIDNIDTKSANETLSNIRSNQKINEALNIKEEIEQIKEIEAEIEKENEAKMKELEEKAQKEKEKDTQEKDPKTQQNTKEPTKNYQEIMKNAQLNHEQKMARLKEREKELEQKLNQSVENIVKSEHDLISLFKALQEVDTALADLIGNKRDQANQNDQNRKEQFKLALQNANINGLADFGKELIQELAQKEKQLNTLAKEQEIQDRNRYEFITKEMDKLSQDPSNQNTLANIEKFVNENSFKRNPQTNKLETTNFAKTYPHIIENAKKAVENSRKQEQQKSQSQGI